MYNAYLPMLVETHWRTLDAIAAGVAADTLEPIMEDLKNELSQKGFAAGYAGTMFAVILAVLVLALSPADDWEERGAYDLDNAADVFPVRDSFAEQWGQPVVVEAHADDEYLSGLRFLYSTGASGTVCVRPLSLFGGRAVVPVLATE